LSSWLILSIIGLGMTVVGLLCSPLSRVFDHIGPQDEGVNFGAAFVEVLSYCLVALGPLAALTGFLLYLRDRSKR
jgi:hypothetical protein